MRVGTDGNLATPAAKVADAVDTVAQAHSESVQFDYPAGDDRWFSLRVVPSTSRDGSVSWS